MFEEVITLSYNFKEPIGVIIGAREINGIVEDMDEADRIKLAGEWYRIHDIAEIVS